MLVNLFLFREKKCTDIIISDPCNPQNKCNTIWIFSEIIKMAMLNDQEILYYEYVSSLNFAKTEKRVIGK